MSVHIPDISFNLATGHFAAALAGVDVLRPAATFAIEIDGRRIDEAVSVNVARNDRGWRLEADVADGVTIAQTIVARAGGRVIESGITISNRSAAAIRVSLADSLSVALARRPWRYLSFASTWGTEFEPESGPVSAPRTFETRAGRSSLGMHPWVGLESDGAALVMAPAWSGNWHVEIEGAPDDWRVRGGLSPYRFETSLAPGGDFVAPAVFVAFGETIEAASIAFSSAVGEIVPRTELSERILTEWNHWWPYEDKLINEDVFVANAAIAGRAGLELSLLDAGWFGTSDADSFWKDVRGDFDSVNVERFPSGIGGVADRTRKAGTEFGIWMEVEAVGPKAEVRRQRPEIMARREGNDQAEPWDPADPDFLGYVCMGSPEGRAHVANAFRELVARTGCKWIKVDFNLDPGCGCTRTDHGHGAGDGLYHHYMGLYAVLDAFRADHPDVLVEACSSGGLRLDTGLIQHVHFAFLSDPDWTEHHLQVVHGASRMFPPVAMLHFTESEWRHKHADQHLSFDGMTMERFDQLMRSGYLHRFGVSYRLPDMPEPLLERLAWHVTLFKEHIAPLVRDGVIHRLTDTPLRHGRGERAPAFQMGAGDRHLVLGFALDGATERRIARPTALRPDATYRATDLSPGAKAGRVATGAQMMDDGFQFDGKLSCAIMIEPAP